MIKEDYFSFFLISLVTLSVGVFCLKFLPPFSLSGDSFDYNQIAQNLIKGEGFSLDGSPTAKRAPGYPFFLAFLYLIFGHNYQTVRFLQFLFLAGIGVIIYFMARKHLNLSLSLSFLTTLLVIFWPYLILYSTLILTEILFIFFLLVSIYLFLEFSTTPSFKNALLTGFFFGLANLFRPVILLLPFWMVFFFLIFGKKRGEKFPLSKIFLLLVIFLLILTPWTIRNYLQFHKFIPISAGLSSVISKAYIHLNYTQGSQALEPGKADLKTLITARFRNIYLFWNPGAEGERAQILIKIYPWVKYLILIYKILFFTLIALAFFSLRFFIKRREIFLLWITILYFWILHIILFPYPRYTLLIIPLVILLSFDTINYLSSQYKPKDIFR